MAYVPLWCKSNFSFLEGASHPEELVATAHGMGLPALALTDRDGVYGIVRAYVEAQKLDMKLIVGGQATLTDGSLIVLLAQDRAGYANLCRLFTQGRLRAPKGQCQVTWEEVCVHAPGLIALWGGAGSLLVREAEPESAGLLREAFGDRLYALLTRHLEAEETELERRLRGHAERLGLPLAAAIEVLYHSPERRPLQDTLTCVRHGVALHAAGRLIRPNAEHALCAPAAFAQRFADLPEAIARTLEISKRCTFEMTDLRYRYPSERLPSGLTSAEYLWQLTLAGAERRFPEGVPASVREQVDKELALIEKLDYPGYFLTLWEIVEYCGKHAILCQGRGSAANSAVCYCLGITAVNPVETSLLFERFLSAERAEPPDIDLDIQHNRREEVIQYVYGKYGRSRAAMVANLIRYRPKSAVRDIGKALGLPAVSLASLSPLAGYDGAITPDLLQQAGLDPGVPAHRMLMRLGNEVLGFPRHLSIHPGGFLLGHEPVHDIVPVENATMPDRTVIQWDKEDVEAMKLFKVDLLALGALSQLDICFRLLKQHRNLDCSLPSLPREDAATYSMMSRGDTVGVFQIESRAQMAMLPRLRPKEFYDLVIEISIVRPGPITGGMVHPYLKRRRNEELVQYPHPCLEPVLKRTLGVPLFQEQVIKLAMVAADYTPGEADLLRRDMAAWRRTGRIGRHREALVSRMERKGIAREFGERVFKQIEGFGDYGFPESHAASFALIAYASAWLKCHYPAEFTCGLLNAQPMGFYSPATIVEDAKRHEVEVRAIDVCRSAWDCTLEPMENGRFAVRMGVRYVKGFSQERWNEIERLRDRSPFLSAQDFMERSGLDRGLLERLAKAGALEGLEDNRRQALWAAQGHRNPAERTLPIRERPEQLHFSSLTPGEQVIWDYTASSHSVRGHPLAAFRPYLRAENLPDARGLAQMEDGCSVSYIGVVLNRQHPQTAKGVTFMTLEDETGFVNVVMWKGVFDRYQVIARTAALLGITGKLQKKDGVTHVVAEKLWRPDLQRSVVTVKSRDFR